MKSRKAKLMTMPLNNYTLSDHIPYYEYPLKEKSFPYANEIANQAEKQRYGEARFKQLNDIIERTITPLQQVAGHHNKDGQIFVHSLVPPMYRMQVAFHEIVEHREMAKQDSQKRGK